MDIVTKTRITRVISTTVSAAEVAALALVAAKSAAGIDAGSAILSSKAEQAADGSVSVEVVIDGGEQPQPADTPKLDLAAAIAPIVPTLVVPSVI